jgi:hypothetical protein
LSEHEKTTLLIKAAHAALAEQNPMTLRQLFYRLVASGQLENTIPSWNNLSRTLVTARKDGRVPWEWIEDRLREPRIVPQWANMEEFAEDAAVWYRRDMWKDQPSYFEAWLEKDALSGIFESVLWPYGVTLNVGRGYDGWTSICEAAKRYENGKNVTVLYFGDYDPSGLDMVRSLQKRLAFFNCYPTIEHIAITEADIVEYGLVSAPTKTGDKRREKHIEEHGDVCVELDALSPKVLKRKIKSAVESLMDMKALRAVWEKEMSDRDFILEGLIKE